MKPVWILKKVSSICCTYSITRTSCQQNRVTFSKHKPICKYSFEHLIILNCKEAPANLFGVSGGRTISRQALFEFILGRTRRSDIEHEESISKVFLSKCFH